MKWILAGLLVLPSVAVAAQDLTSPGVFFGHQLGADRKLARWDRIVEYYELLDDQSDRITVIDLGPTTEGHPFLLAIITSPENQRNLERIRQVNRDIQNPRVEEEELSRLIGEGKVVVSQSLGLHSTEVGGAQAAPEITYDLLSRNDPETLRILDNVVTLLFPCFNPDGQIMVTDWYRQTLDSEYEGVGLPWLYQKYTGHDNNRDGDFLNMIESGYIAKILYRDWKPQAYVDHHQMGSYGARFYVPPYSDPIRPYADPLMWRELSWYGAHIAYKLEENGKAGVLNAGQYPGWGHFGWHWITPFHNMSGMLTESASASLATPLYLHPDQLQGGARGFPSYEAQSNIPNPWPGGWWRLRDIVEQQKIAAMAILDIAARHRETVLWNSHLKAKRQTERGASETPRAYVVPAEQHDRLTAVKMVNTLLLSDVEVQVAREPFNVAGMSYQAGSFVVSLAQPKRGLIRNLLGRTLYPDNEWTRARDGSPLRPYDTSTHTMAEFMGVRVDPIDEAASGDFETIDGAVDLKGSVQPGSRFALDGRENASFKAVNLLIDRGVNVRRADAAQASVRVGDFLVAGVARDVLVSVASETGVTLRTIDREPPRTHDVARSRVGMYQRYRGGNMDEGWTRMVLEQFAFPYTSVMDDEIKAGGLASRYDVILLPHDSMEMITGDIEDPGTVYPPEYMTGIGDDGLEALKAFVREGGTLITMGEASELGIDAFDLDVRNVLEGLDPKDFFCPGSTLRVSLDTDHPLARGMPAEGLVLFWEGPAFQILPSRHNDRYETVANYVERDLLQSGWLVGEEHLSKRAAMVSVRYGEGRVVLVGFRPQHRAQTHGTYKLLFNAMLP